jgi:hypothetical protein
MVRETAVMVTLYNEEIAVRKKKHGSAGGS